MVQKPHNLVIYIHGKGGSASESMYYDRFFPDSDVIGFDYKSETPWQAAKEFSEYSFIKFLIDVNFIFISPFNR